MSTAVDMQFDIRNMRGGCIHKFIIWKERCFKK